MIKTTIWPTFVRPGRSPTGSSRLRFSRGPAGSSATLSPMVVADSALPDLTWGSVIHQWIPAFAGMTRRSGCFGVQGGWRENRSCLDASELHGRPTAPSYRRKPVSRIGALPLRRPPERKTQSPIIRADNRRRLTRIARTPDKKRQFRALVTRTRPGGGRRIVKSAGCASSPYSALPFPCGCSPPLAMGGFPRMTNQHRRKGESAVRALHSLPISLFSSIWHQVCSDCLGRKVVALLVTHSTEGDSDEKDPERFYPD